MQRNNNPNDKRKVKLKLNKLEEKEVVPTWESPCDCCGASIGVKKQTEELKLSPAQWLSSAIGQYWGWWQMPGFKVLDVRISGNRNGKIKKNMDTECWRWFEDKMVGESLGKKWIVWEAKAHCNTVWWYPIKV